jgi:radical SAM superfamily enzyme YgiQ (UPF0313 family)
MKVRLIYPIWERIYYQTKYILPPLGVLVVGGLTPDDVEVELTDENVGPIDFDEDVDLVAISTMLLAQAKRAYEIADKFRARGVKVVMGGLSVSTVPHEAALHADAIVIGEAEGVWPQVLADFKNGELKKRYSRSNGYVPGAEIGSPRRKLLNKPAYNYRGVEMLDLIETSRGCKFACYPCQVPTVSGSKHRIKAIDRVIEEMASIPNDRLFIVDNSLEQNEAHQLELFRAMAESKLDKKWVAHPISVKPEILEWAQRSGCWYVYHAIFKPSDLIRERIKLHHDHGIGVEGTIMVGLDNHDTDIFKEITDFLLEVNLDLAEFTVLTPFPGTRVFDDFKANGRMLHEDWSKYNAEQVVFKPKLMSPEQLEEGYRYCWTEFYKEMSEPERMYRLFRRLSRRTPWRPNISAPGDKQFTAPGIGKLWGGVMDADAQARKAAAAKS